MSQLSAGLIYLGAIALWALLMVLYVPILTALGVPGQVAATAAGVGTLVVIAAVIVKVTGYVPARVTP